MGGLSPQRSWEIYRKNRVLKRRLFLYTQNLCSISARHDWKSDSAVKENEKLRNNEKNDEFRSIYREGLS